MDTVTIIKRRKHASCKKKQGHTYFGERSHQNLIKLYILFISLKKERHSKGEIFTTSFDVFLYLEGVITKFS